MKILIVDKDIEHAFKIVSKFGGNAEVVHIEHAERAIVNVMRNSYNLIILGDRLLGGGDTFEVALEIKNSNKNKHTPVLCIANNLSKLSKLVTLLRPYGHAVDVLKNDDVEAAVVKISSHLSSPKAK